MKTRHIIFCEKMDNEELKKFTAQLRSGVDVESCREENGMFMLSVTGRKKKGRPGKKQIDLNKVIRDRANGIPIKTIAEEYNCSASYLYQLLQKERRV